MKNRREFEIVIKKLLAHTSNPTGAPGASRPAVRGRSESGSLNTHGVSVLEELPLRSRDVNVDLGLFPTK